MDVLAAATALLSVDAADLDALVARLQTLAGLLRTGLDAVRRAVPADWSGLGRGAAGETATRLAGQLTSLAVAVEDVGTVLGALSTAVRDAQGEIVAARRVLVSAGPQVHEPVSRQVASAAGVFDDADRRAAAVIADELLARLTTGASHLTAAPLWRAGRLADAVANIPLRPGTPAEVAVWWAGLPASARTRLTAGWTWIAGPPDGVPNSVRDAVNRSRLASALAAAEEDYQRTRHPSVVQEIGEAASRLVPWPISWVAHVVTGHGPTAATRVAALRTLATSLRAPGTELLEFDPGGDGRAVVATGDVETGRSVAVFVPGMNTELADVPRLEVEADRLAGAAGRGTVVVTWLGYDAPTTLQVASDAKAKAGAGELQEFTAGLRSTGEERQHLTVVAHSYGTLVAGIAARRGLAADDLVLLASPGVEASRAAQLRLPSGHVWAARAPTDPIQLVFLPRRLGQLVGVPIPDAFGPDPAAAGFGAHRFSVGGAYGHSGYFTPGSQSLDNLARIVSGRTVRS